MDSLNVSYVDSSKAVGVQVDNACRVVEPCDPNGGGGLDSESRGPPDSYFMWILNTPHICIIGYLCLFRIVLHENKDRQYKNKRTVKHVSCGGHVRALVCRTIRIQLLLLLFVCF